MLTACLVCFTVEGKLDIFKNGKRAYSSVPIAWLECYLAPHGICGEDYKNVVNRLYDTGMAFVKIPTPPR